jgi:hypothetical protein
MKMAEKTEELGGNVPRCPFVNHKSHTTWPGIELVQRPTASANAQPI